MSKSILKLCLVAAFAGPFLVAPFLAAPARADADDAAWIKKCVADNKNEGAKETVIAAYCSCMNGKMSSSETLSVSAWEKKHPDEMAACSKEAGWK